MAFLTLKIDADTDRGTREGVPNLVRMLTKYQARATFLFSLGPDHTGWALKQVFRPGFFKKVSRTSVVEHYGLKTLMYGVLLPAPDIGKTCATYMQAVQAAGFECGIHTWDHRVWQDHVRQKDSAWTQATMQRSYDRFNSIFGVAPKTHGAAGWQMNPYAFKQLEAFNIAYSSDGRAMLTESGALADPLAGPHRLSVQGSTLTCIQLPTTLPTLDELLGRTIDGIELNPTNIAAHLLKLTATPRDHVFTLHAELEGQKLAPIFEQLLQGWRTQGYDLVAMEDYYQYVKNQVLPTLPLSWAELPGRSGDMIMQGEV
ncbi:polysaccharide deacetylase family protein [Glaciimonas immobilis]|uniref:Peptidoglycan/xylan/chitin deacetylase (PgdA/CDA1 family) n=1 Tax=Glaciimonas immobilis TaxID=728004 RepID=A0A840RP45_9BURK|nr:polysaccharide deacetylase family protein [Glaciimonas immobilis]KAF3999396.1 polysaccharide deacetylase family protein [Glaciimonas immobilis]MBB5198892.1 peptidoglycan/xylan/chitin deacetylase (PgdA/CDA1 family) [Glaciimonas immobilis]